MNMSSLLPGDEGGTIDIHCRGSDGTLHILVHARADRLTNHGNDVWTYQRDTDYVWWLKVIEGVLVIHRENGSAIESRRNPSWHVYWVNGINLSQKSMESRLYKETMKDETDLNCLVCL